MWCESFMTFSRLVGWAVQSGFATFCHLAGVDPLDAPPGLPSNADSLNSEPVDTSLHFHMSQFSLTGHLDGYM